MADLCLMGDLTYSALETLSMSEIGIMPLCKHDIKGRGVPGENFLVSATRTRTVLRVSNVVYLLAPLVLLHDNLLPMLTMSLTLNAAWVLNLDI